MYVSRWAAKEIVVFHRHLCPAQWWMELRGGNNVGGGARTPRLGAHWLDDGAYQSGPVRHGVCGRTPCLGFGRRGVPEAQRPRASRLTCMPCFVHSVEHASKKHHAYSYVTAMTWSSSTDRFCVSNQNGFIDRVRRTFRKGDLYQGRGFTTWKLNGT